jgi:hypothetical protein
MLFEISEMTNIRNLFSQMTRYLLYWKTKILGEE